MCHNILEVKNLTKKYHNLKQEVTALKDISFSVKNKEFITIVGPSGCGKSTILSILAQIIPSSYGEVLFKKKNPTIGYMLQQDALFDWKTIYENCLIGLKIKNKNKITKQEEDFVLNLLKKYGLYEFKDNYPDSLSGGMRQRVALIRTLAINPDILLLDEPFSALDYQTRLSLSDDVYNIIKNEEKTAIMVTHDIAEAISISNRIIVLSKRPSTIKKIYNIELTNPSTPTNNRKDKNFLKYHDMIWKELDQNV